jgi:outer membrane PBP1 activator LpoA protein
MRLLFRLLPLVLLLAACATPPRGPITAPTAPYVTEGEAAPAYSALAGGDYARSAALFRELAAQAKPPKLQEYQLGEAEALLLNEQLPEAAEILGKVRSQGMDPRDLSRLPLLQARLALKKRDAEGALAVLSRGAEPSEPALIAEYHYLRAQAFAQMGNPVESAREFTLREPFLSDPGTITANQRSIYEALSQASDSTLQSVQLPPPPDLFGGWVELARIAKSMQAGAELENQLALWRQKYPSHPAQDEIFATLREHAARVTEVPSRVALLLPLTGNLHDAANAVRDGVLAAHYASARNTHVVLRTYDTSADPKGALDAYEQATREGAQFVIGPLRKEDVEAIARRGSLPVPVLALNSLDAGWAPSGLYQFGLAPEDEARQVAERAWADGHTRAALITPTGTWGSRIAQAFHDRWLELGGTVAVTANYEPQENDYAVPLRTMLNIDGSDRRLQQVEHLLGHSLEFQPRRRQDIDFIFVAAFPRQARLLRPQIKFHHADDLTVYATSHAFTGMIAPDEDRDMDGTVIGDMPWVLEGLQPPELKSHEGSMARLVALGVDAYNLLRHIRLLEGSAAERYDGATGVLQMDGQQRIHRQLVWARFDAGRPRLLQLETVRPRDNTGTDE